MWTTGIRASPSTAAKGSLNHPPPCSAAARNILEQPLMYRDSTGFGYPVADQRIGWAMPSDCMDATVKLSGILGVAVSAEKHRAVNGTTVSHQDGMMGSTFWTALITSSVAAGATSLGIYTIRHFEGWGAESL